MGISQHVQQVRPAVVQAVSIAVVADFASGGFGDYAVHGEVYLVGSGANRCFCIPATMRFDCSPFVLH